MSHRTLATGLLRATAVGASLVLYIIHYLARLIRDRIRSARAHLPAKIANRLIFPKDLRRSVKSVRTVVRRQWDVSAKFGFIVRRNIIIIIIPVYHVWIV